MRRIPGKVNTCSRQADAFKTIERGGGGAVAISEAVKMVERRQYCEARRAD
jgi:hypothetical protein